MADSSDRPLIYDRIWDLEARFRRAQWNDTELKRIRYELSFRSTARAKMLAKDVDASLRRIGAAQRKEDVPPSGDWRNRPEPGDLIRLGETWISIGEKEYPDAQIRIYYYKRNHVLAERILESLLGEKVVKLNGEKATLNEIIKASEACSFLRSVDTLHPGKRMRVDISNFGKAQAVEPPKDQPSKTPEKTPPRMRPLKEWESQVSQTSSGRSSIRSIIRRLFFFRLM